MRLQQYCAGLLYCCCHWICRRHVNIALLHEEGVGVGIDPDDPQKYGNRLHFLRVSNNGVPSPGDGTLLDARYCTVPKRNTIIGSTDQCHLQSRGYEIQYSALIKFVIVLSSLQQTSHARIVLFYE